MREYKYPHRKEAGRVDLIPEFLSLLQTELVIRFFGSFERGTEGLMSHEFLRPGIQIANQLKGEKCSQSR